MTPSPGRQARRPPHAQAVHAKLPLRVKFDTLRVPSLAGAPFNQDPRFQTQSLQSLTLNPSNLSILESLPLQ